MKSTVAFPFAVPARTLAVLVLGAFLGGLPRVAHSQTALPAQQNTTDPTDAPANTDLAANLAAQAQQNNGTFALNTPRIDAVPRQPRPNPAERRMRDVLARSGITTTTTQDAILTFLREDEQSKRTVRDSARRLWNGMRRDVPAERLRALLSDYQKSMETERQNRKRAQTALDARVGYSLDPRLESLLWLLGVLGEGQNFLTLGQGQGTPNMQGGRGPRIAGAVGGATPFGTYNMPTPTSQMQIEGVVNAKNLPQEPMIWLEIRDANGRLWRMVPSTNADAQPILNRQIGGLSIGTHVLVRVVSPVVTTPSAPYSLLALAPANDLDRDAGQGGEQEDGAENTAEAQ